MPASPLNDLLKNLRRLDYTRERMEKIYKADKIVLRDLHSVYEALFIRAVTNFETFLQDQFMAIMKGKATYKLSREVSARMTAVSPTALEDILLQGRAYATWLPYENTKKRAHIYMKDGKPFSDVPATDLQTMTKITTIRNAIAHQSAYAVLEFETQVIAGLPLLPQEKKPAGFLRSPIRVSPRQSRFEFYVTELGRIATAIC